VCLLLPWCLLDRVYGDKWHLFYPNLRGISPYLLCLCPLVTPQPGPEPPGCAVGSAEYCGAVSESLTPYLLASEEAMRKGKKMFPGVLSMARVEIGQ
jgi:hypothetical protein